MSVFVVGALHWDIVVRSPRLPREDETLVGDSVAYQFGGKGGNQAIAAARAGASVILAGRVGCDDAGSQMLAVLQRFGIDTGQVQTGDGASGMSTAIVDEAGAYQAVIVSAENLNIDANAITLPENTKIVVLQNEVPTDVNYRMVELAAGMGVPVLHNAAPARTPLSGVEILVANKVEAADLLRLREDELIPERAVEKLCETDANTVVITLGGDGVVFNDGDTIHHHPAHEVPVVSTHGAGDVFVGTLAAQLVRGQAVTTSIVIAQRAAALHVSGQTGS